MFSLGFDSDCNREDTVPEGDAVASLCNGDVLFVVGSVALE